MLDPSEATSGQGAVAGSARREGGELGHTRRRQGRRGTRNLHLTMEPRRQTAELLGARDRNDTGWVPGDGT
jgi:hypothetical protein